MSLLEELAPLTRLRWLRLLALITLLVVVGVVSFRLKLSVIDLDVWWHLKVGDWIIAHAAFPHHGILSRSAANRPWAAYSWGYEVLLSRFYAWFGLLGIGIYGTLLTLAVAFAVYWMARRLSERFWPACVLAVVCCYAFLFLIMPRPMFFSIILFCLTLTQILEAQRSGRIRTLYWLPLIFLFWANLHIQFIYGLAVVGLLVATNAAQRLAARLGFALEFLQPPSLPLDALASVFAACVLATLIGPYSYHLYGVILDYAHSKVIYATIKELLPLGFRGYENYAELLLAAAAFFAIGWQKKVDLFKLGLLAMASVVGLRTMRDSWFLCIAAAACIADAAGEAAEREPQETPLELAGVLATTALVLLLFARGADFTTRGLDGAISSMFPVNAVNFLRQNPVPGPLYNTIDWGGFLIWYMPNYPVVIDGRTDLYGDRLFKLLFDTQNGEASYKTNPYLNQAGVVLLRRQDGLVAALDMDPRFRKIYEDRMATVFVRQ
ncbi:MAG TPA: hypothetical protein VKV05_07990 [Terriglobales bacterium]|nr:hypothetical protein [Terriglobales bacterium]